MKKITSGKNEVALIEIIRTKKLMSNLWRNNFSIRLKIAINRRPLFKKKLHNHSS